MNNKLNINQWAEEDRPREKFMQLGAEALSKAELLAILIGSGSTKESAVDLMKHVLKDCGDNLNTLGKKSLQDLMKYNGIGEAKAVSIMAALELGKRRRVAEASADDIIKDSATAYEHFLFLIDNPGQEHFFVMYLNQNNKLLKTECISKGGLTQVVADPKVIFKSALDIGATNLIVCHNHPSGNPTPSETDRLLTKKLVAAGKLLDIQVTDHIIIGKEQYYSFLERGQMIF